MSTEITKPFHFPTILGGGWVVGVVDEIKAISAQLSWSWGLAELGKNQTKRKQAQMCYKLRPCAFF